MQTIEIQNAFKEWAIVIAALLEGRQTIILRKGGITEKRGTFSVDHENFFLFPTYLHQKEEDLIKEEKANLSLFKKEDSINLKGVIQVEEVHFIDKLEILKQIQPFTIWSQKCLEDRFNWGDYKGIHLILSRVSELSNPLTLPHSDSYEGCKSWVELEKPLQLGESKPVLNDEAFLEEKEKINTLLNPKTEQNY